MAEKTSISLQPQRLRAPESQSFHLHTLIKAYQVPGTETANMASTLQSEGGKRNVYLIPLVFQAPVLGGSFLYSFIHLLIYTFIDLFLKIY